MTDSEHRSFFIYSLKYPIRISILPLPYKIASGHTFSRIILAEVRAVPSTSTNALSPFSAKEMICKITPNFAPIKLWNR